MAQDRSGQRCTQSFDFVLHHLVLGRVLTQSPQCFVKLGQLAQALKYIRCLVHKPDYRQQSCQHLSSFCNALIFNDLSSIENLRIIIDVQRLEPICAKIALVYRLVCMQARMWILRIFIFSFSIEIQNPLTLSGKYSSLSDTKCLLPRISPRRWPSLRRSSLTWWSRLLIPIQSMRSPS